MRPDLWAVILLLSFSPGAQRGVVTDVRVPATVDTGTPVTITVSGSNPCGAVNLDYGDGSEAITHAITEVPVKIQYTYTRPGRYEVRARGMGNCDGDVTTTIRAVRPREERGAAQPLRFREMDTNADGVITLSEWRGSAQSFRVQDRNRDGVLSGDEVRGSESGDWTDARFADLDRDRDRRISRDEWQYDRAVFRRADRNSDGVLTRDEFRDAERREEGNHGWSVVVPATERWTNTGVYVRAGETVTIAASGSVWLSPDQSDVADPAGARSGRRAPSAPLSARPAGALIARIGNSNVVFVGDSREFRAPVEGQVFLGVNDDYLADNRGEFRVTVGVR
jgi:Ca2+-binding EF-hand superfamily protein